MSTKFEIFPTNNTNITFRQLIDLSELRLKTYLQNIGINKSVKISMEEIQDTFSNKVLVSKSLEISQSNDIWIKFSDDLGGATLDCTSLKEFQLLDGLEGPNWALDEIKKAPNIINGLGNMLEQTITIDRVWMVERNAGQSGLVNVGYGLVAAALAEITDGIIYSSDGAWQYSALPMLANEFYKCYMNPLYDETDWSNRCIEHIRQNLG